MASKDQDQRRRTAGREGVPGRTRPKDAATNARKDPEDWITGDERMTGAQASYLRTLSDEAGEPFDESLTKAQASERIEELQRKTGRGLSA